MSVDLFDAPVVPPKPKVCGGYASPPGHGPAGETCGTCAHSRCSVIPSGRRFWKCNLRRPTGGPGTDIRLKSPACRRWERQP